MSERPARAELARRIEELADGLSGEAFAAAARSYADGLEPESRAEFGELLLARAGGPERAIRERWEERHWFRRLFRRMSGERR